MTSRRSEIERPGSGSSAVESSTSGMERLVHEALPWPPIRERPRPTGAAVPSEPRAEEGNSMFRQTRNQKGVTLVELMVVVAIIAIIAAIAITLYQDVQKKARLGADN